MRKNLLTSCFSKVFLLIAMLMASSLSAFAQATEWETLELNTLCNEPDIYGTPGGKYQFTPTEDGVLTIYSQDQVVHVYTALNADGSDILNTSIISSFSYCEATINGVTFGKKTVSAVTSGTTYYVACGKSFSKGKQFIAVMDGDTKELKLESVSQPTGQAYNITDARDGQVELEFSLKATADDYATLTVGEHTAQIETRSDVNTDKLIYALKETLYNWMQEGYYTAGEKMTLTITGIHAIADESIIYGTDGTLTLEWTTPGELHRHVSTTGVDEFLSYWIPGDTRGIATLEFDYDLMTIEDGQTATAIIQIGNAEMGDAYEEKIDASKFSVDGKYLYVDFTGKLRSYEAMGLTNKWSSITIKVGNILMADNTNSFSETQGNYGSVTFTRQFTEYRSDVQAEFTPASGSSLTDNFFKVYFSDKKALTFGGVRVSYQTLDDIKYQKDITEGITSEEQGLNGIEYTIPLTDEIVAGKNIRISFINQVSADGYEHNFDVLYNPGPELTDDLAPVSMSVNEGDVLSSLSNITLTFDTDVVLNTVDTPVTLVRLTDATSNVTIPATIAVDADNSKKVVITPSEELTDAHKYNVYVPYFVIVNQEYNETEAKYGRYMKGLEINFTISSLYANYDFATDPIAGSTVTTLSAISCTTKPNANLSTELISPTRSEDAFVYVVNESDEKVTDCTINDDVPLGFGIVLNTPITESGKYFVVIEPGVYCTGEGYNVVANEDAVRIPYTVLSAPQEVITITATDPVSESTVESLSQIMVEFSEPVYGDDVTITVANKANYTSFEGTLTINPKLRTVGMITLEEEITEEGTYTVYIPSNVVGDELWYNNDHLTGNCNALALMYFTIGGTSGGDDFFTVDPANGSTVESLSHIKITFNQEGGIGSGMITVKKDGVQVEKIDAKYDDDFDNVYDFHIYYDATEEGEYTFEVPEGYFVLNGNAAPAFTLTYYIGGTSGGDDFFTVDPANGSTVESLSHIKITFNQEGGIGSGMITVKKDGVQVEKIDAKYDDDFDNVYDFHIYYDATEEGEYTFEVPEGYFVLNGNAAPAFTLTYYVKPDWTTDPANGSTVSSLHVIKVWNNTVSLMGLGSGKISVKKDGVEIEEISQGEYGEDWNQANLTLSTEYTESGVYTLEVPEGFFLDEYGYALPAVTFTYYISTSGINSIFADENATANIYTTDGRILKVNATKSDVNDLNNGIYIIGNQKVIINSK
ncbi:MAG: Ig-like domain-containing protein [Muribaculaceae bacterium]